MGTSAHAGPAPKRLMSGALKFCKDVASKVGSGHVVSAIADEIDGNNTEGAGEVPRTGL
jgi:hypothetical protein